MIGNPGFYEETHWRFDIAFVDVDGVAIDLGTTNDLLAILYNDDLVEVFRWLVTGYTSHQGIILIAELSAGIISLDASKARHENVAPGYSYTWTLYDIETPSDPRDLANGTAYIGRAGEKNTSFVVLHSYPGTTASGTVVAIKGDKGDPGTVTDELENLRDQVAADREATEAARDDAEGFAGDAEDEAEQALTARIGAQVAQAAAELAAIAAAALGGPIYATVAAGLAGTVSGEHFVVQGPDPAGGLIIYRNLGGSPETAQQIGTLAGSGEVHDLDVRVTVIEPLVEGIVSYLPDEGERPLWIYDNNYYDDYLKKIGVNNWVHINPQTLRLDVAERAGVDAIPDIVPDYSGRIEVSEDGTVVRGIRHDDGFHQYGPSPTVSFQAFRQGADGAGTIWVAGESVPPFCISGENLGDNVGLVHHGYEGVSWFNIPPAGVPARQTFSFLPGVDPDAIADTVETLVLLVGTGDSAANGTLSVPVLTDTCPAPGFLLMYDATPPWDGAAARGVRVFGTGHLSGTKFEILRKGTLKLLVPAHESEEAECGETQWTQAAYELQKRLGPEFAVLAATVAIGSIDFNTMSTGAPYENLLTVIRQTYAVAKMRGLDFRVVVGWPQLTGSVGNSLSSFLANLTSFQCAVSAAVDLITSGAITNVLVATNGFTNGTKNGLAFTEESLAQLQFAIANPTKGVYATPCFTIDRLPDAHFTNVGAARDGAYIGRAIANQMLGNDALPLYTTSASIVGGSIVGTVHIPFDGDQLVSTSPIVTDPGNLGFKLVRSDTQANVPITSVTLTGANEWTVVPTAPPAGVALELSHGFRGTIGELGGPLAGARTPINDDQPDLDFFGDPFPNHLAAQRFTGLIF